MLKVENLMKNFGGIQAVHGVSLTIKPGTITGLIGPNGAGKSTLFNVIAGAYPPDHGRVWLDGQDITGLPPHTLFKRGLLRSFQIAHEFSSLTTLDNLMMVPSQQFGEALFNVWFRPQRIRQDEATIRQKANEVIDFLQLNEVRYEYAGNLSGGQKKLLELGRTMMTDARIVFLDEVGAGVNRVLLKRIGDAILRLNKEQNYTFCMIEHDMDFIGRLCQRVICMAEGEVLATGSVDEIKSNPLVIEAYLGRGGAKRHQQKTRTG
ncbi:MAG: ABC transporter ATP-binding protein [Proteobacteria bacterium]|nr:ABC transporter ATP-binding protein [Pseudomonadota bacterium]